MFILKVEMLNCSETKFKCLFMYYAFSFSHSDVDFDFLKTGNHNHYGFPLNKAI